MLPIARFLSSLDLAFPRRVSAAALRSLMLGGLAMAVTAHAQEPARQTPVTPGVTQDDDGTIRMRLPTVTVKAEKEPENVQDAPVSVTAVTRQMMEDAGVRSVSDAAQYAPNTYFNEFSARKLSNARFRGIGSSPNNPAVTTFIDGVPQLNANSSSIELLDIDQIEFVRGPQSALFGRNTLGGLVNITSARPSRKNWMAELSGPYGNFNAGGLQGTASGPLGEHFALGVGAGYSGRDGYTTNTVTGHDLDSRSAVFSKTQLLWTPAAAWDVRGIVTTERARDGDYALNDLAALRAAPRRAARDFEGFTHRDLVAPTILVNRAGKTVDFSATTGFVWWKTDDLTDLDYTPLPLIRRANGEDNRQFTEELRVASAKNAAHTLSDQVTLRWQAGLFLFSQNYTQDAVNMFSPFVLSQFVPFAVDQHSPQAALDDHGVGVYGRGTLTFSKKLDAAIGVRADHENKAANLNTFYSPAIAPPANVDTERSFNDVSPQFTVSYHVKSDNTLYATAARGFKAGGFNAASPPGAESYGQEHSWNYEGGVKTSWLGQRLSVNAAVFYIDWTDLQVNVPNPLVPAQFYVANAGTATSKGFEVELTAQPQPGLGVFASVGHTSGRFGSASVSSGVDVSGNTLSNMPDMTSTVGLQYSHQIRAALSTYGRAELVSYGRLFYDDANTASQSAYSLANFRAGVRTSRVFAELWLRNAFDTHYIPTAFAYPGLAPSGFVGESGAPRTGGIRAGVTF
jgi:iron complex outermembrane receptor protein